MGYGRRTLVNWLVSVIFQPILNLVGGPVIQGLVNAYKLKLAASTNIDKIAADLAGRELVVQQRELELQSQLRIAEIGKWYEPDHLFAYVLLFYFTKVYVYDAALGLGSTDPVGGDVASWAGLIMAFYFGKRGIENVVKIMKGR